MNYTIQDLANGNCAVINDGTLKELKKVLSLAFPTDEDSEIIKGTYKFYHKSKLEIQYWTCDDSTDLPTQSVKYFLSKETYYEVY
jgi:hypothetical protein